MKDVLEDYGEMLYRYLYSLCGNHDTAEDLVQETFYHALKAIDRFDGSCKFSTWLCQIGKHMWYNELRRRNRKREVSLDDLAEAVLVDNMSPEKLALSNESYMQLLAEIHDLSAEVKEVFYLRAMGGLSFKDIGSIMGRSESWARVTYFRARQKLFRNGGI